MYGGYDRNGPKFTRAQAVAWYLSHCKTCGASETTTPLLRIESRLLNITLSFCHECAAPWGLHERKAVR